MIYQVVPEYYQYDAISQHARHIEQMVRENGLPCLTCAGRVLPETLATEIPPVQKIFETIRDTDVVLFHFSIHTPLLDALKTLPGRKVMIYHNITPPHFFEGISRKTALACERGKAQLAEATNLFDLALGVSRFNEEELKTSGYRATDVLPLVITTNAKPSQTVRLLFHRKEEILTLLHVGKWAPNKKIEDIVKIFYWIRRLDENSRLILVGRNWEWRNYTIAIHELIHELKLQDAITIIPSLPSAELEALYKSSNLYISMSEHEGFCAPLIEAMASNCPVFAYNAGAIPETIEDAGVLWDRKDFFAIAEGIHYVMHQSDIQSNLKERGKRRAKEFTYESVSQRFKKLLPAILGNGRH